MKNFAIKFSFIILCFSINADSAYCQKMEELSDLIITDSIYTVVDEEAEFPGGFSEFLKFLHTNFVYPSEYTEICFQGKLFVKFIVRKDGTCSDFRILRGIPGGPHFDKSTLDLLKKMPVWKPAKINGKEVDSYFILPISIHFE